MVYFCLRNDSGRAQWNQYLYKVSTSHLHTYLRLYKDFVIIVQRDCRRNLTTMKWSDATTAQNSMTQFDEIISEALFLFLFSINIYEILMDILETLFIMKLHKILLHLQRKLWHMFCSTYYSTIRILLKKEEMCWLITSNGLSVAISTYFIVMFRQESDNNSLQLSQKPSLAKSSW